jgi:hypothetical protein
MFVLTAIEGYSTTFGHNVFDTLVFLGNVDRPMKRTVIWVASFVSFS